MSHRANRPTSSRRRIRAFTLVETMISLVIMGFLMIGAMDMYINALRMASRSTAEVFASQDAAVAMRNVEDQVRESLWLSLPDDTQTDTNGKSYFTEQISGATAIFPSLSGTSTSNFISTDPTHTYTADSAMFLAAPALNNAPTFVTSLSGNLNGSLLAHDPYNMYNRIGGFSGGVMVYRANSNGTPNPTGGTCLWELSSGANPTTNRALVTSLDPNSWNAVQFDRPLNGTTAFDWEVEIKITSSYYSAINGVQTNEATNGTSTTQLVGRCVAMRDHAPGSDSHKPNAGTTSTGGNRYQATTGSGRPGQAG